MDVTTLRLILVCVTSLCVAFTAAGLVTQAILMRHRDDGWRTWRFGMGAIAALGELGFLAYVFVVNS